MSTPNPQKPQQPEVQQHVREAHSLLTSLRAQLAEHPELEKAILELELALDKLTIKTAGML
ncbi:MAG TPA: hypothetical protein VKW78_08505 [Terriglobales bacterium]|nr:hypothetical protein [Terriglobales bacterium]